MKQKHLESSTWLGPEFSSVIPKLGFTARSTPDLLQAYVPAQRSGSTSLVDQPGGCFIMLQSAKFLTLLFSFFKAERKDRGIRVGTVRKFNFQFFTSN